MLKTILLLTPVYVTLFWSVVLNTDTKVHNVPRLFLGKFMIFAVIVYLSHLLYFYPLHSLYVFIDPFYQLASLIVYPLYYIYFRLLTIDNKFSLSKHGKFILLPCLLFVLYIIGVIIMPVEEYTNWVLNRKFASNLIGSRYLDIVIVLMRFTFLIQLVGTVVGNMLLVKKHGKKAAEYYSNMEDSSTKMVKLLNLSMIITATASLTLGILGREFFVHNTTAITLASATFSSMLFLIGWLGNRQKPLNPQNKWIEDVELSEIEQDLPNLNPKKIHDKLSFLFHKKKIYLYPKLTILDVAKALGTNRTYISNAINQQYNQNFCSFVNSYRINELKKVILENPGYSNIQLAESCGFGSVDSMKRAVNSVSEISFTAWRKQILTDK